MRTAHCANPACAAAGHQVKTDRKHCALCNAELKQDLLASFTDVLDDIQNTLGGRK